MIHEPFHGRANTEFPKYTQTRRVGEVQTYTPL